MISLSIYQVICPSAGKMPVTLNSGRIVCSHSNNKKKYFFIFSVHKEFFVDQINGTVPSQITTEWMDFNLYFIKFKNSPFRSLNCLFLSVNLNDFLFWLFIICPIRSANNPSIYFPVLKIGIRIQGVKNQPKTEEKKLFYS